MIVLDTHAWIWWLSDPDRLSPTARQEIEVAAGSGSVYISAISCWELALLAERGRLELTVDIEEWLDRSRLLPYFRFVSVDPQIAVRSVRLPGSFHADPADRILIATALALQARLVTKDRKIRDYPHVETIW